MDKFTCMQQIVVYKQVASPQQLMVRGCQFGFFESQEFPIMIEFNIKYNLLAK